MSNVFVVFNLVSSKYVMIVMFVIFHYILRYTSFGRNCYAVGGDYNVAQMSGIKAKQTKWATFVISGMMGGNDDKTQ